LKIEHLIWDKACDDQKIHKRLLKKDGIKAIIPLRVWENQEEPWITTCAGVPKCVKGEEMVYWGYEAQRECLKYRCPLIVKGERYTGKCLCMSESKYGQVIRIPLKEDYRRYTAVARETKKWNRLYNLRTASERVNSRLKEVLKVEEHHRRGKKKIRLWISLRLGVMSGCALAMAKKERWKDLRSIVAFAA